MVFLKQRLRRVMEHSGGIFILNASETEKLRSLDNGHVYQTILALKNWSLIQTPLWYMSGPDQFHDFPLNALIQMIRDRNCLPVSFNVYQYQSPEGRIQLFDMDLPLLFGSAEGGWPHWHIEDELLEDLPKISDSCMSSAERVLFSFLTTHLELRVNLPSIKFDIWSRSDLESTLFPVQYKDRYLKIPMSGDIELFDDTDASAKLYSKAALIRTALNNAYRLILGFPLRPVFFVIQTVKKALAVGPHITVPSGVDPMRARRKGSIHLSPTQVIKTITDAELRMVYKLCHEHPSPHIRTAAMQSFVPIRVIREADQDIHFGVAESLPHIEFFGGESGFAEWTTRIRTADRLSYKERAEELNPEWITATTAAAELFFRKIKEE